MSAQATETRSAASVGDLAELILSTHGNGAAGTRLPTERELVAELGVTRTAVRHALAILEAQGRISREVGRGTFVRGAQPRPAAGARVPTQGVDDFGPAEVMAARRLIEPQVLPLVVAWATTRDFDELRRCLEGGASATSAEEFEVWDYALHHAIVAASRNQLLVRMYAVVERAREGELWGSLKRRNDSRERRAVYQSEHEAIVGALVARELAAALAAMEAHLVRVEANLLGGAAQ
ncbi:MAG TPA: FCD domain-containing protein [Solirubrobacteraceae bacterium]|jgi:DNA-binding FadR family transcriptional regulator|nr:FCD domain-containing protein [Solirubrobacteraceae bacterium]